MPATQVAPSFFHLSVHGPVLGCSFAPNTHSPAMLVNRDHQTTILPDSSRNHNQSRPKSSKLALLLYTTCSIMEPINRLSDVELHYSELNMKASDSLFDPFESELREPTLTFDFDRTPPIAATSASEHGIPGAVTCGPQEASELVLEMFPGEQVASPGEHAVPTDAFNEALYDAYPASYAEPITNTSTHMQHARELALALLQRHHPESQGYLIEPVALGPYSARGINFLLKEDDEPDSDLDTPPRKKHRRTTKLDNGDPVWHYIDPANMAAFVVKHRNEGLEPPIYRTHTCLVIILDDLSTFPRWSRANMNHRGDVLTDLLGVIGHLKNGHGMLFFGPRLELYTYDANNTEKPVVPYQGKRWKLDMRSTSLAEVDEVLKEFKSLDVVYRDGV